MKGAGVDSARHCPAWLEAAVESIKANISRLDELPDWLKIYTTAPDAGEVKKSLENLKDAGGILEKFLELVEKLGEKKADEALFAPLVKEWKKKDVYMAVRHALTARKDGPELIALINILGRQKVSERVKLALKIIVGGQECPPH